MDYHTLAEGMLYLQNELGCHNINFVSPSHLVPQLVRAVREAVPMGLRLPLVYNTNAYDSLTSLNELDGIIDIFLPDAKYSDDGIAREVSGFSDYVKYNRLAIVEMFRQVGTLKIKKGLATGGLIIRHLILPENLSGTGEVMRFIADSVSPNLHISLMDQYFPAFHALKDEKLNRRVTQEEYDFALLSFEESGLHNGWIQEHLTI